MTKEKVEKANQLLRWMEELKDQKNRWEESKSICRVELNNQANQARRVEPKWINFEEVKLLAIARISKRLEELQEEFNSL